MLTTSSGLIGQRQERIAKAEKLRELGINPYPAKARRTHLSADIVTRFADLEEKTVVVAGRLMLLREHGKIAFAQVQDQSGRIQLFIRSSELTDLDTNEQNLGYAQLKLLDVGDIVEAEGKVVKTKTGEISVLVNKLKLLTKAIRPLPDKWAGLKDKEALFRQRYLDMIINPDKRWRFAKTAQITFAIREYLNSRGFLEIKTPILQPLYGGGTAKPFTTKVNALDVDFYMAISHELYLKRLIVAGFENVYNLVGYFRNEGIDRTHNPEFSMLETMTAYQDYQYNMDLMEGLYRYIGEKVFERTNFKVGGQEIDFGKPWERIKMLDAVKKYAGYDFATITTLEQAHQILREIGASEFPASIGESMVKVFEAKVEEKLIQPTFVYGHPVEISPLAKRMNDDKRFVERFEIFIGGIEGGDNWTELNDPLELYERFKAQVEKSRQGDSETHPMDVDFLEVMEYGMPPTTGVGPGIERLAMMYTETEYIDDVIFFPMLRPAPPTLTQQKIYGQEYLGVGSHAASAATTQIKSSLSAKVQPVSPVSNANLPSRAEAMELLTQHVKDNYQILHAKMVAAALEAYAKQLGADPELWYTTGLLHDLDYFEHPTEHPQVALELFRQRNFPAALIQAVAAHAAERTGVIPSATLDKALMACDEFSGLLYAYALMRPTGFTDMEVKSVSKKYKDKRFAPNIDRQHLAESLNAFALSFAEHVALLIDVFKQMPEFSKTHKA